MPSTGRKRKGWDQLAEVTRIDYQRHGITREIYEDEARTVRAGRIPEVMVPDDRISFEYSVQHLPRRTPLKRGTDIWPRRA